jgi:recombination protein RecA
MHGLAAKRKTMGLEQLMKNVDKEFGKGSLIRLGDKVGQKVPSIPTGLFELDNIVIGSGGIPLGRITEFFGPEMGGKSSLALATVAEAQKLNYNCVFIDAEHSFDPTWAEKCGVDVENLLVSQPENGEVALELADVLIKSEEIQLIVVDSVAALVPKAELDGDMGDRHIGLLARLMSQAMRKICPSVYRANCAVIFINQIRENIGNTYNPTTTPGGKALKHTATLRLDIRRLSSLATGEKKDREIHGTTVKITAAKNKVSAPYKYTEVELLFTGGFDKLGALASYAVKKGIIKQSGTWYSYNENQIGQGISSIKNLLTTNNVFMEEIKQALLV